MKIFRVALMLALVFAILAMPYGASAVRYTSYTTTLQIYNLEGGTASISMYFYNPDGSIAAIVPDTIAGNDDKTYTTLDVAAGFDGSMTIFSSTDIAAISNIRGTLGSTTSDAAYVAAKEGNPTIQLPLLQKNNGQLLWNSWFNVQNVGSDVTTVSVKYSDIATAVTRTIQPYASVRFDQSTENHPNRTFAAEVTSTSTTPQDLAVTVINEHANAIYAYTGFAATSTNPVMPLINYQPTSDRGWTTGMQIQNTSTTVATNVTVSYTPSPGAGTACTETQSIPPTESRTFALNAFASTRAGETCINGARFVGSAKVTTNTGNVGLTVIVNQQRSLKVPASYFTGAYGGFDTSVATNRVVFPLIQDRNGAAQNFTGFNVMNVGNLATTVTCTFTGSTRTVSQLVQPNAALNHVQWLFFPTVPYVGSAICTASGGDEKIVGVINQQSTNFTNQDRFLVSEGVNTVAP